jgi:phosphoglycolate phosphatase
MSLSSIWPNIQHVVLDWNGTLLDDLDLAVESVNRVCRSHGMPLIDHHLYRAHFQFPIAAFYQALGFDFEAIPFPTIVQDYLQSFDANVTKCSLQKGALAFLDYVRATGRRLSVLSASFHTTLADTIHAKGLTAYFEHVSGLADEHATSKLMEAHALHARLSMPPETVLCIGDTTHDAEIANILGWHGVTLSCGHQDETRLAGCSLHLASDFQELLSLLAGSV